MSTARSPTFDVHVPMPFPIPRCRAPAPPCAQCNTRKRSTCETRSSQRHPQVRLPVCTSSLGIPKRTTDTCPRWDTAVTAPSKRQRTPLMPYEQTQPAASCSPAPRAASHSFLSSRYTLWSTSMASSLAGSPDSFISSPPNETSSSTLSWLAVSLYLNTLPYIT